MQTMCRRLGLTLPKRKVWARPWSEEDNAQLIHLRAEGKTQAQIAVALDRTARAVKHRLLEVGLPKDTTVAWRGQQKRMKYLKG